MKDFKEIPYKIEFKKESFYNDYMKWYKFKKIKRWIFISILFTISLIIFLNVDNSFSLWFLLISAAFFCFEIYDYIIQSENIKDAENRFFYKDGNLVIKPTSFRFSYKTNQEDLFFSQIDKLIDFNDVIFFDHKAKGRYAYRLNKSEISSSCYLDIIKTMKMERIKIIKSKK